ncbi:MAG: shikimate kinase [Treponema sp.]|nr:shikimate kinase [Treponema sp.]
MKKEKNIILIGMPGCGKSSIGTALAKMMNIEFADTDELIIKTAGKSIPDIFTQDGEEIFRKLETEALQTLCNRTNKTNGKKPKVLVIATGGGIVTRPENQEIIKQNGIVFFLDRELSQLPTTGRPLSQKEGIEVLAKVRMPLYSKWSDYTVPVCGIEETAKKIHKQLSL